MGYFQVPMLKFLNLKVWDRTRRQRLLLFALTKLPLSWMAMYSDLLRVILESTMIFPKAELVNYLRPRYRM